MEGEDNGEDKSKTVATDTGSTTASVGGTSEAIGVARLVSSHRNRKDQIVKQVPDSGDLNDDLEDAIRSFFLWGYAVIEYYSAHLIRTYIIDDKFNKSTWDYIRGESRPSMSQSHREELLKQSGIFDGIEGRISNVRYIRNKLAHEPFSPIQWKEDNIETEMKKLVEIIDKLNSALDDEDVKEETTSVKKLK